LLTAEVIFQSLVSVTAILFGLFAVFLSGFESARRSLGKHWIAYAVLSVFIGASIVVGALATLLAYWATLDSGVPFGLDPKSLLGTASTMLEVLVLLEIIAVAAFGIAYLITKN
jgi:hypothetical protein